MELATAYPSWSSVNDLRLVTRVVAGEAAAERELYETYVDRIYRLSFRLAGDDELARDFTQATFIRAFEKIGSFRGESTLSTWLHSIGMSVALNGLRKSKRVRSRETPQDPEIRRKALFWLGQSGDRRAIDLFEELLTKR